MQPCTDTGVCSCMLLVSVEPSLAIVWRQELHERALTLLNEAKGASPSQAGARAQHWPSIRVALEGLKLNSNAVQLCKQFLLQVTPSSAHSLSAMHTPVRTPSCTLPCCVTQRYLWLTLLVSGALSWSSPLDVLSSSDPWVPS